MLLDVICRDNTPLQERGKNRTPSANLAIHRGNHSLTAVGFRIGDRDQFRLLDAELRDHVFRTVALSGLHPADEHQMAFVQGWIVLGSADVDSCFRRIAVAAFEDKELANLLKFLLNLPCRHGASHALFGVGNVHPVTGRRNGRHFSAFVIALLLGCLMALKVESVLGFDGDAVGIGFDEHAFSVMKLLAVLFSPDRHQPLAPHGEQGAKSRITGSPSP
jgi:hypothetical protein